MTIIVRKVRNVMATKECGDEEKFPDLLTSSESESACMCACVRVRVCMCACVYE